MKKRNANASTKKDAKNVAEECEAEVKRLREALPGEVAESLAREAESRTGVTPTDDKTTF